MSTTGDTEELVSEVEGRHNATPMTAYGTTGGPYEHADNGHNGYLEHDEHGAHPHPGHHDHGGHNQYGEVKAFDHNEYATRKTAALGLMDVCLLTDNAYQLRTLIVLWSGDGFQIAQLIFILISVLLQMILAIILLFLAGCNVNHQDGCTRANTFQKWVTFTLFCITVINIFSAAFHMIDINPSVVHPFIPHLPHSRHGDTNISAMGNHQL